MKASPRQQLLLLDLQDLDTTAQRLRRRRDQIPERAQYAALEDEEANARDFFMSLQRELDQHRAEISRIELDVRTVDERRDRDLRLMEGSVTSKEAQALQHELDVLARRKAELEDRELEVMQDLEEREGAHAEAEAALRKITERREQLDAAVTTAEAAIDAEIATHQEERAGLAAELQRDVLALYEETRSRRGIGAARLRGNVSEGSNMTLGPSELAEIRAAAPDEIVFCPDSGAILVRADETAAEQPVER